MRKAMETEGIESEGNSGEHTDSLKKLDEKAITDDDLINTVEGRMDFLKTVQNSNESAESEEVDETPIPDVPEDGSEEENGQAAVSEIEDGSTPKEDDTNGQDGTVTIPEAYVRAAIHHGWKQEDVDKLVEADPELALTTLTSCYNSVTNSTKEWSALGRAKIQTERANAEAATVNDNTDDDLQPLLDKLKENYADDPLMDVVSKLLKNTNKQAQPQSQNNQDANLYHTETARATAAAAASTDSRVNGFFSGDAMKSYEEFYGKLGLSQSVNDLTNGQQEHRLAVLNEAECIMTGKRMRNLNPTIEEVLEEAHFVITEPIREQVIISNLKKTALDRKKTLRPAKSKKAGNATVQRTGGKPKDRTELLTRVEQRLAGTPGLRN